MKITLTLSRYLMHSYIINTLLLLAALLGVVYLFDTIELIRRASKTDQIPLGMILQMGLFKLPEIGQIIFPFAILFSAIYTFWQLNRRSELVIFRASGFSIWQFIFPVVAIAILIGIVQISIINPIGAILVNRYHQLENQYLEHQENQIALFREGLWLRQSSTATTSANITNSDNKTINPDYVILHAKRIQQPGWILIEPTVYYFKSDETLLMRLDADQAKLEQGKWIFQNAQINSQTEAPQTNPTYILPTHLTIVDIEESFSSPQSLSFWQLPAHIKMMEETGFNASHLHVYYQSLMAQPLLFIAMILLAATVSMRPPRYGSTLTLLSGGIFIGFFVFFLSSYLQALGASQQIPAILAAWSPATICLLLGLTTVMILEDG